MEKLTLGERLQILEDKEAIKDLTYRYALSINQGWNGLTINPEEFKKIFTTDAVWESKLMKIRECGVDNIIESLKTETNAISFAMHSYSNPLLQIKGDTADGNWLSWVVSKLSSDQTNQVFMSQDIKYLNTNEGWRMSSIEVHFGELIKT